MSPKFRINMVYFVNFALKTSCGYSLESPWVTHCRLNELPHTIYWKILILIIDFRYVRLYEGCSKRIAYFYLVTSNFKLAQNYSFHALEVLPVARNAKFQQMYPLLEGVTVR